jgi:plastocyanin
MVTPALAFPSRPPGGPVESFGGTGYVNSGILQNQPPAPGAPPNNSFTLTFPKAGVYQYICLVHLSPMIGWVEVVPPTTADVLGQSDIDAQAKAQAEPLLALVDKAKAEIAQPGKDVGPNNTTLWYVHAGANEFIAGDFRAQILEFGPKVLTIKAGDTVIWGSTYFHTVTFNPTPPPPEFVIPKPQPNGPPILSLNPLVGAPIRPAASYDPTKYYNSGILGPFGQQSSWALTFDKPGTYDYFCAVHRDQGMKATVVVQPK